MYSQNDPKWKNDKMGLSYATLGRYGCTTSCIATLGSYFGETKTPGDLARLLKYTPDGRIFWKSIGPVCDTFAFEWRFYTHDPKLISKALKDPDTAVLLNVDRGYHWVSLIGKVLGAYKCSDPYPYPAKTRLYRASDVVGGAILKRK